MEKDHVDDLLRRAEGVRTGQPEEGEEAESTLASRARYWALFEQFCGDYGGRGDDGTRLRGLTALPAEPGTLTEFVGYLAHRGYAPATIRLALSAVRARHRLAGETVPDGVQAAAAIRGYQEELLASGWQPKASAPARTRELERLVEACDPATAQGLRDRALVLVGYSVAATRAALARLNIDDVRKVDDRRYEIVVSRGENKAPRHVVVPHWGTPRGGRCRDPLCPLCAVFAWTALLRSGGVDHGPLFRPVDKGGNIAGIRPVAGGHDERISVTAVNLILRRLRRRADLPENITPHSLRAGFAMESIEQGAHERDVRRHGGWVANSTAFNVYTRDLLTAEERSSRTVTRPNPLQRIAERRRALPGERTG